MSIKSVPQFEHACLVSVSHSVFAPESVLSLVQDLSRLGHLDRASSVYRVFLDGQIKYTAGLLIRTNFALDVVFAGIVETEKKFRHARAILLCFDDQIYLTPKLTVPYPRWMTEPHLLVPAAEVWGDYHHPIAQDSLYKLAQQFSGHAWGEFYSQGATLTATLAANL